MPNYTKNVCTIIGAKEKVESIINKIIVTEESRKEIDLRNEGLDKDYQLDYTDKSLGEVDFNRLIPTPTNIYQGVLTLKIKEELGAENCWQQWRRENWGSTWNASETEIYYFDEGVEVSFWTAWSAPLPFLVELAHLCYDLGCKFSCDYADEDFGGLMGILNLTDNGECSMCYFDSDEEHYRKVWGDGNLSEEDE